MPYQYKREPLTQDEANRLANACRTHEEKLVVWTLLDTGLRVSELANLRKDHRNRSRGRYAKFLPGHGEVAYNAGS